MLLADAVGPFSPLGLEGLDGGSAFFIAPDMNPRRYAFASHLVISRPRWLRLAWSMATTWAVCCPRGRLQRPFLARGTLFVRLPS